MQTLEQVGILIDSVDASRYALRTRMEAGTTFDEYTARMRDIHSYVKKAEKRIAELEQRLKANPSSSPSSYIASIKKLRHDLEVRDKELRDVREQVDKYRDQNQNLVQTIDLQKAELDEKIKQLEDRKQELDQLVLAKDKLQADTKAFQADAYYQRGIAVEEAANRTRFAPKKKRKTRMEALELYRLAAFYGKEEAEAKVKELEKKIKS